MMRSVRKKTRGTIYEVENDDGRTVNIFVEAWVRLSEVEMEDIWITLEEKLDEQS
jgi:hypothetical protein